MMRRRAACSTEPGASPACYTTDEFDPDPYMDMLNQWGMGGAEPVE